MALLEDLGEVAHQHVLDLQRRAAEERRAALELAQVPAADLLFFLWMSREHADGRTPIRRRRKTRPDIRHISHYDILVIVTHWSLYHISHYNILVIITY